MMKAKKWLWGSRLLTILRAGIEALMEAERTTNRVLRVGNHFDFCIALARLQSPSCGMIIDLKVPIGMLYCLKPMRIGVDFNVYR